MKSKTLRNLPVLSVKNLSKRFRETVVLREVNLEVWPGEAVALLGANGAGKSTTLRCLVGEIPKDTGVVTICGVDLDLEPLCAKAQLGYAADLPFFYPYLSGEEHLRLWAAFRRLDKEALAYGRELAERLELVPALSGLVRTYSRGMRQKLAFIGALFHRPALILLDEPFTAMDQASTEVALALLDEARQQGAGVLFTSHQTGIVECLHATTIYLRNGTTTT
ncbi:MAG: ABC transporter ATP-binding protein [Thermogemmatispora sp.]|jgi:ABC-2 type transport system ATP-binding protein|uniref:ABC transporter ATP-binding protein n=1 Tax=Thermogemmatispora sp. TaxID=1968838 RepID=UPI0019DBD15D|nr:ABC transporter ATP-binding protein [Thermogemmatispora sp.]MBE3567635.1 ABC transporter ATP-binding protein [Thermogemmatispora sp.]